MINSTNINLFFVSTKHSDKKNKSFFNGRRSGMVFLYFSSAGSMQIKITRWVQEQRAAKKLVNAAHSAAVLFHSARIDADKKFGYPRGRQVKTSTNKKPPPFGRGS